MCHFGHCRLRNAGSGYRNTRHNIGFDLIDHIAKQHNVAWKANARFEAQTAFVKQKSVNYAPKAYNIHES